MKRTKITFLFVLLMSMVCIHVNASDIVVSNGGIPIYYNFINNDTELSVTRQEYYNNNYTGSVTIPSSVTYNQVTYPVTSIGDDAFRSCGGLTSVTIPNSVTSIGDHAFFYCSGLTSVTIPNSVTSIGDHAFEGCSGLTSLSIGNSVTSIGENVFSDCQGLISVTIPESVTSIGTSAFYRCRGLTTIDIPNSVTSIGSYAFEQCSGLTSVTIPSSVTSIGDHAFYRCVSLTVVIARRKTPITLSSDVFLYSNTNATLFVPSVAAYQAADYWKYFKVISDIKVIHESESITLNSLGMGTYCSDYDLDFTNVSGIKAYVACGFNPTTGIVFVMHVNEVPANTGIMIKGTPGTYSIPVTNSDMYYSNMFKGTLTAITVPATEDGNKNYVLASDKLFHGSLGGSTLTANRAYLQIPLYAVGGSSNAPEFITLEEDNVTGIVGLENTKQVDEGETYNLNGQRVVSPKKGLYIRNGKKVIINK